MKKNICKLSFDMVITGDTVFREQIILGEQGIAIGKPSRPNKIDFDRTKMRFGFWGNSNDANKFYPDAGMDNIMPKPEDFMAVPFRLISATIVGADSWKATDFSNTDVLKASIPLLDGLAVMPQHDAEIYNWIGYVANPYWDSAKTIQQNGKTVNVPAGINADLMIDVRTNPKIARGLAVGAIFSNSVTVLFESKPSHQFETEQEFNNAIGSVINGQMVTRQVTNILDYYETSLVWLGADPFAKILDEQGNPERVDISNIQNYSKANKKEKNTYSKEKKYYIGSTIDRSVIYLSKDNTSKSHIITKNEKKMNKFFLAFIAAFGTKLGLSIPADTAELTDAQEQEAIAALAKLGLAPAPDKLADDAKNLVQRLKAVDAEGKLVDLVLDQATDNYALVPQAQIVELFTAKTENAMVKEQAQLGKEFLEMKRTEAIRQYNIAVDGKEDAAVVALFNKATSVELDGLLKQYGKSVTAKFQPHCTKCNSAEHISMRQSMNSDEADKQAGKDQYDARPSSFEEMRKKYGSSSMVIGKK